MLLSDLKNIILVESGEYLFADIESIQLNMGNFWILTKRLLNIYQKYHPVTQELSISIYVTPYTFTPETAPVWISRAVIAQLAVSILSFYYGKSVIGPLNLVWRYQNPTLYVSLTGDFNVRAHYNYAYTETRDPEGNLIDVNIPSLDESHFRFIDYVKWGFLKSVSRARSMYILGDLPIQSDAQTIYQEASQQLELTLADIKDSGIWYEAIGQ